jgi:hypothetical protein
VVAHFGGEPWKGQVSEKKMAAIGRVYKYTCGNVQHGLGKAWTVDTSRLIRDKPYQGMVIGLKLPETLGIEPVRDGPASDSIIDSSTVGPTAVLMIVDRAPENAFRSLRGVAL